jgi:hypothetical protein
MKSLFTIFELFELIGVGLGTALGSIAGFRVFGLVGLVVGGVLGFLFGVFLGKLPANLTVLSICREFRGKSDDELREALHRSDCNYPNFILLELNYRGGDISSELPVVLDMLESPDLRRRRAGVAAITSAFPDVAAKVPDYRPGDSVEECRRKIRVLRGLADQAVSMDGEDAAGEP